MTKLDVLAIGAHPDDMELGCGGTLINHQRAGYKTGVLDLTRGEMGTRGSLEIREQEANAASKILQLEVRENLELSDGWFEVNKENQLKIITAIRKYRPEIVLATALYDRHPDHGRGATLVEEAIFKSGLTKIETTLDGEVQDSWRPKRLYHYIQSISLQPDFYVDVSDSHDQKIKAVEAYKSQFFDPKSKDPDTYISNPGFMNMLKARAEEYGHRIGCKYAEGFLLKDFLGVKSLFDLL